MAGWAGVLALTGFHYPGVDQTLRFAAAGAPRRWFWSNGAAWGTIEQRPAETGIEVCLRVLHGTLRVRQLALGGADPVDLPEPQVLAAGAMYTIAMPGN